MASILKNCIRECDNRFFRTFDSKCAYGIQFTNKRNIEENILTISDKSMGLIEINKKLKIPRQRGFIFNQIDIFTIKFYGSLSNIKISYSLKV